MGATSAMPAHSQPGLLRDTAVRCPPDALRGSPLWDAREGHLRMSPRGHPCRMPRGVHPRTQECTPTRLQEPRVGWAGKTCSYRGRSLEPKWHEANLKQVSAGNKNFPEIFPNGNRAQAHPPNQKVLRICHSHTAALCSKRQMLTYLSHPPSHGE